MNISQAESIANLYVELIKEIKSRPLPESQSLLDKGYKISDIHLDEDGVVQIEWSRWCHERDYEHQTMSLSDLFTN
jgi:hypothetical protein